MRATRREFLGRAAAGAAAALGAGAAVAAALHAGESATGLPTVRWGKHEISRLLVGHNPQKGQEWFPRDGVTSGFAFPSTGQGPHRRYP